MTLDEKIIHLTKGAKFDVSCSSSGAKTRAQSGYLGSCAAPGICHSFSSDGRCISLLKILLSNNCVYDCLYCACRRTNDIPRVSLSPKELCELVIGFYKRNYIEGLFLSSAVDGSPDKTMELLYRTVLMLRTEYKFLGYIHLKAIPGADPSLVRQAAEVVDRMSVNIELPSYQGLKLLAPSKTREAIIAPMKMLSGAAGEQKLLASGRYGELYYKSHKKIIPAGQTTQMIVGATQDSDSTIIRLSEALYNKLELKRVYYSAYIPLNQDSRLPSTPPDLRRENRLYQADWLLRFYGFSAAELLEEGQNLNPEYDPKCDWALRNPHLFPIEINSAPYEMILRVPGIGVLGAWRIMQARKFCRLCYEDLQRMRITLKRARHFITIDGKYFGNGVDSPKRLDLTRLALNEGGGQLSFWNNDDFSTLTGEL